MPDASGPSPLFEDVIYQSSFSLNWRRTDLLSICGSVCDGLAGWKCEGERMIGTRGTAGFRHSAVFRLCVQLAAAFSYALLGFVALTFQRPLGYASLFWPAAGLALALALRAGPWRFFLAFWAGSAFVSFWVIKSSGHTLDAQALVLGCLTGLGAPLQAAIGTFLIHWGWRLAKRRGYQTGMSNPLIALALGGPPTCVVSASLGVLALKVFGMLGDTKLLQQWVGWWFGDVLGVWVVLPLFFLLFNIPDQRLSKRRLLTSLPGLVVITGSIVVYHSLLVAEHQGVSRQLNNVASRAADRILKGFQNVNLLLTGLAESLARPPVFSEGNLKAVEQSLKRRQPWVEKLGWYESDFKNPQSRLVRFFSTPSEFVEIDVMNRAVRSGSIQISDVYSDLEGVAPSFLAALPVFQLAEESGPRQLLGVLLMQVSTAVVTAGLRPPQGDSMLVEGQLKIMTGAGEPVALFEEPRQRSEAPLATELRAQRTISFGGRTLILEAVPATRLVESTVTWLPWALMVLGLLSSSFISIILCVVLEHSQRTEVLMRRIQSRSQQMQKANRAKTDFLAHMSHEIRTPMTSILGFTELMLSKLGPTSSLHNELSIVQRNGEYLLSLINDVLDLSKIEAGQLELQNSIVSLDEVIRDLEQVFFVRARSTGIRLIITKDKTTATYVQTDSLRLKQVLINLISNAYKFSRPEAETIQLILTSTTTEALKSDTRHFSFSVVDQGVGIRPEDLKKLFKPFTQLEKRNQQMGTGLGLSISDALIKMMGGRLTVTSEWGRGSTFCVDLDLKVIESAEACQSPQAQTNISTQRQKTEVQSGGSPKTNARAESFEDLAREIPQSTEKTILIVEDAPDTRLLLSEILKRCGYRVLQAANGKIAVDDLKSRRASGGHQQPVYDLVLMDMEMPVMSGYEAARLFREAGYQGPLVALTAHALAEEKERCLTSGCNAYLTKPIRAAEFVRSVKQHLELRAIL